MTIRPTDDEWMDMRDVARILLKNPDTIRNERSRGAHLNGEHPPSYKFGGRIRYRKSEVDAWIEAQREAPPSAKQPSAA
jgi:predicted DNA-binding transcriptional regulator AlpA